MATPNENDFNGSIYVCEGIDLHVHLAMLLTGCFKHGCVPYELYVSHQLFQFRMDSK